MFGFLPANFIVSQFQAGGPIMWPILGAFVLAATVVVHRSIWWWLLRRRTRGTQLDQVYDDIAAGRFGPAIESTADSDNPYLATIQSGLLHAHSSLLGAMQLRAGEEIDRAQRMQWILGTLITLSPLLGLLGTVTGIMRSFNVIGNNQLAPTAVSGGIAEALIATACGLGIAILSLIPYNFFNHQLSQFRSRLERTINHVELLTESARHHGHDLAEFSLRRALGKVDAEPADATTSLS